MFLEFAQKVLVHSVAIPRKANIVGQSTPQRLQTENEGQATFAAYAGLVF